MSLTARYSLDRATLITALSNDPEVANGVTMVDLREARFVDAVGLVGVVTQVEDAAMQGRGVLFRPPNSTEVARYLSRMGMGDYLDSIGIRHSLPTVRIHDRRDRLSEVTRCSTDADFRGLAELAWRKIDERRYYPELADVVYEAIMELGGNVLEHSQVASGFAAAQTYKAGEPDEYLVFAVGDVGIGVRASLTGPHHPATDAEAVELAMEEGVSGTGDRARGLGLSTIIERAAELAGSTFLASGTAFRAVSHRSIRSANSSGVPGTLVGCWIRCHPGQ